MDQAEQGSTVEHCSRWPDEGHSWSHRKHAGLPTVWTRSCSGCGFIDVSEVRRLSAALEFANHDARAKGRVLDAARAWWASVSGSLTGYEHDLGAAIAECDAFVSTSTAEIIDGHPESYCHRCGGPNIVSWFADSPVWNQVMRGGSINGDEPHDGIVCPVCFAAMAYVQGVATRWRLSAEDVRGELETVTPSGRVWNDATHLWMDPPAAPPSSAAVDACRAATPVPRTWTLPPEPGLEVTRVLDAYGQYFERGQDEHPGADTWIGQVFAGDADVPDLELEWPMLMAYQAPLTDATPARSATPDAEPAPGGGQ